MRLRNLFLITTLFFLVVLLGVGYFKYRTPAVKPTAPVQMVVAATSTLGAGALLKPQDLTFIPEPAGTPHDTDFERPVGAPGAEQDNLDHQTIAQIVGAVVRRRIEQGAPIARDAVVKPGDSGFLAAVLQPGMQAITIGVTAVSGAGGLIYPGDRVDVILTQTFVGGGDSVGHHFGAETVAQNVRVLAIDQQLQNNASQNAPKLATTVTVEAQPREAAAIVLASKLGDLSLTIRSLLQPSGKSEIEPLQGPVWAEDISPALESVEQAEAAQKKTSKAPNVMLLRGADTPVTAFPDDQTGPGAPGAPGSVHTRVETVHSSGNGTVIQTEESN
jgi:pilus assembly protein CpaB